MAGRKWRFPGATRSRRLSEAGIRVIAPDQRGYGATDRPEPVEAYDMEHLTGDLVGLLDHLKIDKAIFVGHDWGGFVVWQMPLRHLDRVAGVVGVNTPHYRSRAGRSDRVVAQALRRPACISCSFRIPRASPTGFSAAGSSRPSMPSCASRCRASETAPAEPAGRRASAPRRRLNLAFPQMIAGLRRQTRSAHADPVAGGKAGLRRHLHRKPASPAASTGTATCRATGSARRVSTTPCGCRR